MISKKKIAITITVITIIIISIIAVTSFFAWQYNVALGEVENTVRSFIGKLNIYDATGAWALTSQTYRITWPGGFATFKAFVNSLNTTQWHSEIQNITKKTIETKNEKTTANFTLTANITDTDQGTYTITWTFTLTKNNNQWLIDNWRPEH
ncbi:MAG: hypothetical protein QXM22_00260 [Candidatus Bathyarchaeia archaeon]